MAEEVDPFGEAGVADLDATDLDNAALDGFGEVSETIEFPHLKMATKSLKKFADISKIISVSGGRDIISKAVCLEVIDGKVVCKATDFDIFVKQEYELMNTENVLRDTVVVATDILQKLLKAAPASTVIYRKDDKFFIRLFGGDVVLESYDVASDKFTFSEKTNPVGTIGSNSIYSVAKNYSGVVSAAVSSTERRIGFTKAGAFAKYMWAILGTRGAFADFDLKPKDIAIVRAVLVNTDEDLQVSVTEEGKSRRALFEGNGFSFSILLSDIKVSSEDQAILDKPSEGGFHVDLVQLYKIVELAAELPYSLGKLDFTYSPGAGLLIGLQTRKGTTHEFTVSGSQDGSLREDASATIQAKLLRVVLRTFAGKSTVKVSILNGELVISTEENLATVTAETK